MTQLSTRTTVVIAAEINNIKDQTRQMMLNNSIEIGRRLVEAKSMLPHGEWGNWLKESVDYSQSTANNLMKIFEEYGESQLSLFGPEAKSQAFGNLSYTKAVALLGVPEEDREQFIEEHNVENMSTRQLQQAIKDNQKLEQQLREAEAKAEKERLEREAAAERFADLERQSNMHFELAERYKLDLEAARASGNDEEARKLQESLEKANTELSTHLSRIKKLEQELKEKPIEVSATTEVIPPEIETELAELREKVAEAERSQKSSAQTIAFKVHFDGLVKGFGDLLIVLDEVKQADPETAGKYTNAVKGLIGKMTERL